MTFHDFHFDERIQKGIDEAGFKSPMPVQAETFKLFLQDNRDIYAQSQTGTGKTAAFLLGIFQLKVTQEQWKDQQALVIVPTRELAIQIDQEAKMLGTHLDLKIGAVYGGVGYTSQEKMLAEGVDILIGTPGRLIDFDKKKKIDFSQFGFLVIDEADRLFDMGFFLDIKKILKKMKPYSERRTMLFSATLNPRVGNLAWEYMNDPGDVIIEPEKVTVDTVTQELYHVGKGEKLSLLLGILKKETPKSAVIFTNTRHSAWEVAKRLRVNGYKVECLMGDIPQSQRTKIIDGVKRGDINFMVATDVAARGLHINELQFVINYDVPLEAESYVHRIGRTARAGKTGKTITLACEEYVYGLTLIEKYLGRKIPVSWADESLAAEDKSAHMNFSPRERYRELGISRQEGPGRRDEGRGRSPRQGSPRSSSRSVSSGRGSSSRAPRGGKRPVDQKTAKIQSVVSTVVGGEDLNPVQEAGTSQKKKPARNRQPQDRENRSRSGKRPHKEKHARTEKPKKKGTVPGKVSSSSSLDDRLEYYRNKYGEDFSSSGSSSKKKSSSRSPKKKKPPVPARKSGKGKSSPQPPVSSPPKTGFFQRLFGKKTKD